MTATKNVAEPGNHQTRHDRLQPEGASAASDDELLTRGQLIAQLKDEGIEITAFDLGNWQRAGIVPHGARRWRDGATRVVYGPEMVDVIRRLRALQAEGYKLRQIGSRLRASVARDAVHIHSTDEATVVRTLSDVDGLLSPAVEAVEAYARRYQERHGVRLTPVAIAFRDEDGHEHVFPVTRP